MARLLTADRTFSGRSALTVKRDMIAFWHSNQDSLGLSLKQFIACCRQSDDGLTVTFRRDGVEPPSVGVGAARLARPVTPR